MDLGVLNIEQSHNVVSFFLGGGLVSTLKRSIYQQYVESSSTLASGIYYRRRT